MNSETAKYFAMVLELPAFMLALGYLLNWYDGPQQNLGGWGLLIGLMGGLVAWIVHIVILMKNSADE